MDYYAHTPSRPGGPWHDLVEHLAAVADSAEEFGAPFGCGTLARVCGLYHDAGKFSDAFQQYLRLCWKAEQGKGPRPKPGSAEHKAVGAALVRDALPPIMRDRAIQCVLGHHGGLLCNSGVQNEQTQRKARVNDFDDFDVVVTTARTYLDQHFRKIDISDATLPASLERDYFAHEMMLRFLFSCLVDADSLDTERHQHPEESALREKAIALESVLGGWILKLDQHIASLLQPGPETDVARVRREVYDACLYASSEPPGVFSLAVPTGGGKTLSSLAFALGHAQANKLRRIIYVIPYTSIIDQTAAVFRKVLGENAVLEHHSAVREAKWSDEDADDRDAARRLAAENWDAPLIVTTAVQFFESLFSNQTSRCRKLHNIAESVVILDEVQTLPVKLLTPLLSGLQSLTHNFGVSLVLCSATQPALAGESAFVHGFDVRPIVGETQINEHFESLNRVTFRFATDPLSWDDLAKQIREANCSTLVVLNTKRDALALVDALAGENVRHLSTLLCADHRRDVIDEVKEALRRERENGGPPIHLVSTQVIEAGVDISFPRGYRAHGPLDRIVQAAGRVNREGLRLRDESEVIVFEPRDGGTPKGTYQTECDQAKLYIDWYLGDRKLNDADVPTDYFAHLYARLGDAGLDQEGVQELRRRFDFPQVAEKMKLIKDDTVPVLCPYNATAGAILDEIRETHARQRSMNRSLWRRVQPYTVAVRQNEVIRLAKEGKIEALNDDLYAWVAPYDRLKGIGGSVLYDPLDLQA
ncbi:MAG: CRISPR-associated helicase Cas3' [Capsulimonadaceae bacterium]|nr:CRISPR-associated helicase Cas3' [Capsulimonadaceae bacterium]